MVVNVSAFQTCCRTDILPSSSYSLNFPCVFYRQTGAGPWLPGMVGVPCAPHTHPVPPSLTYLPHVLPTSFPHPHPCLHTLPIFPPPRFLLHTCLYFSPPPLHTHTLPTIPTHSRTLCIAPSLLLLLLLCVPFPFISYQCLHCFAISVGRDRQATRTEPTTNSVSPLPANINRFK